VRARLAQLVGLAAAGSLAFASLVAGPASAADSGEGTISVTLVDDLGAPVIGSVQLVGDGSGGSLGVPEGGGAPVASSTFTEDVAAGTYGLMVLGGWGGITCVGLQSCNVMTMSTDGPVLTAQAVTIPDGGSRAVTVVIGTPKLTGVGAIGSPLTVAMPAGMNDLTALMSMYGGGLGGLSSAPTIAWNRGGAPTGVTGSSYTVSTADAGSTVSATVTYPPLIPLLFSSLAPGLPTPSPFTTAAVSVPKLDPTVTLSAPATLKQGKKASVYVNVKYGESPVPGVVSLKIPGKQTVQGVLHAGLATFKLPVLKPGTHRLTAEFAAVGAYNGASTTKVVKVQKPKKEKKHKKDKPKKGKKGKGKKK
jgi:hypothetical protein